MIIIIIYIPSNHTYHTGSEDGSRSLHPKTALGTFQAKYRQGSGGKFLSPIRNVQIIKRKDTTDFTKVIPCVLPFILVIIPPVERRAERRISFP